MGILVGLLIIGVVISLTRLWYTACAESVNDANPSPGTPAYVSANHAPNDGGSNGSSAGRDSK